MVKFQGKYQFTRKTGNVGLFVFASIVYIGLLCLFAWQTWGLLDFLFPADQLLMKQLTLLSFDGMAFLWGAIHLFYRFAHPGAKAAVGWGWGVTFLLSLIATILYMVIQSMFRFHVSVSTDTVNVGYGVSIVALVFNIAILTVFIYNEVRTRFPTEDDYVIVDTPKNVAAPLKFPLLGKDEAPQETLGKTKVVTLVPVDVPVASNNHNSEKGFL